MDKKTAALLLMVDLVDETIKDAEAHGIPSGHLYAMLMGHISLDMYQAIVDALVKTKKITNVGHLLTTTAE